MSCRIQKEINEYRVHERKEAMPVFGSEMRLCGTCARWGGQRDPGRIFPAPFVTITDLKAKGRCLGGGFLNAPMSSTAVCEKYVKWEVLR